MSEWERILGFPCVYIHCRDCDGWWFMAVDMPGNKRAIKDALYRASERGDRVHRTPDGREAYRFPSCQCSRAAVPA